MIRCPQTDTTPPQNAGTGAGHSGSLGRESTVCLGRASCNRASSCSARQHRDGCQCHHVPWLGMPRCPHGYRYRASVQPTSHMLEVQGWASRLSPSACEDPHLIPSGDVAGAQVCHPPVPGGWRGGSGAGGVGSSSAGPGAGLGTRACAASAAARSCAHLDFSRLRSTSLLNQMAKINK